MSELLEKLSAHATRLEKVANEAVSPKISGSLDKVNDAAKQVGRAWSGSWIGYQSRVYYADFAPPPPGAHFSSEWGFQDTFTQESTGDWGEYSFDYVRNAIFSSAGVSSLNHIEHFSKQAGEFFQEAREEFLSVAVVSLENKSDAFLSRLKAQVEKLSLILEREGLIQIDG